MNWQVGDKVLCINDKNWKIPVQNKPECGEIYTIREIFKALNFPSEAGILLEEILNPIRRDSKDGMSEPGFAAFRFTKFNPDEFIEEIEEEMLEKEIERMLETSSGEERIKELLEL